MMQARMIAVAGAILIGSAMLASAAPAPAPISCPPCLCDTPPVPIYALNTTSVANGGVPAYQCNNPRTVGYALAQTCNSGQFAGQALYCNPTSTLSSSLGFLTVTTQVGNACSSDSNCPQGTVCTSRSAASAAPTCSFIATADCFNACNACICNPTPAPTPSQSLGRKM